MNKYRMDKISFYYLLLKIYWFKGSVTLIFQNSRSNKEAPNGRVSEGSEAIVVEEQWHSVHNEIGDRTDQKQLSEGSQDVLVVIVEEIG